MKRGRPVNLDLTTIKFPLPAIISILHRMSGVFIFLLIPFMLCALQSSLVSAEGFEQVQAFFSGGLMKFIVWGSLTALLYHLIAGIRHLLMDMGIGETLEGGEFGAKVVIGVVALTALALGVWLW